ncbi:hypothetical protein K2X83_01205 [Patescibacteria group bacterium]|nr:hypothetical protein [Patescibacteria group bacterium]
MSVESREPLILSETASQHEARLMRDANLTGLAAGLNVGVAGLGGVLVAEGRPLSGLALVLLSALTLDNMDKHGALEPLKFWKRGL